MSATTNRLLLSEVFINATAGHRIGETEPYESWTEDPGKLFRTLRQEYGRCVGKVYIDRADGEPWAIGWVFVKRDRYTDTKEPYLREVWVTLHEAETTITKTPHYRRIA